MIEIETRPRLIVLSDLWGAQNSDWIAHYKEILGEQFDFVYYDSCVLGEVDTHNYTIEALHRQFVERGIDQAVKNLLLKARQFSYVLGFSIGGFIAWRASLAGLRVNHLFAISATRLRYESKKPNAPVKLFFGENDANKPSDTWFKQLQLKNKSYRDEGHELYKKREIAQDVCALILAQLKADKETES